MSADLILKRIDRLIAAQRLDEALGAAVTAQVARVGKPGHLTLAVKQATVLRLLQRPAEAVALLSPLLEVAPRGLELRHELTQCLRLAGAVEDSLRLADETLALFPAHRATVLARIDALVAAQRLDAALAAAEAARAATPGYLPYEIKQAAVLRQLQRPAEAVALLSPLLEAAPGVLALRHELALSLRLAGAVAESRDLLDATRAQFPAHRGTLVAQIDTLVDMGDQEALVALAQAGLRSLDDPTAGPGVTLAAAESVARILPHLHGTDATTLLIDAADPLSRAAAMLRPEQIWPVYVAADRIGLGARCRAMLDDLLARDRLPMVVGRGVVLALYRRGANDWDRLAERVMERLPEPDRWRFRMDCRELADSAAVALRTRDRPPRRARPDDTLALAHMLRRAGRLQVFVRYLRRARRVWPWSGNIFSAYLHGLVEIGADDSVRDAIRHEPRAQPGQSPEFGMIAAKALLEAGDFDGVRALAQHITAPQQRRALDLMLMRCYQRRGETAAADALYADVVKTLPRRTALQFSPGIDGGIRTDTVLARRTGATADARTLVSVAGGVVARWRAEHPQDGSGAVSAVPAQVVQYWDKPDPPHDIADLIDSWRNQPGVAHHLFDRRRGCDWLADRLGPDWRRALRAARSPAEESDFFRLSWLMVEGGLYVDCDDRLTGDLGAVLAAQRGLTVFAEPHGAIGNNVIFAPPLHPAIVWAAHAARTALLERHSDNTWTKTGPGLLTRAVAWYLDSDRGGALPDLRIPPRHRLGTWMQGHVSLPYKRTDQYWNASAAGDGSANDLLEAARRQLLPSVTAA